MKECCNYDCNNELWTKYLRCGICRRRDINTCTSCGDTVSRRAVRCKTCTRILRFSYITNWHDTHPERIEMYREKTRNKQLNKRQAVDK